MSTFKIEYDREIPYIGEVMAIKRPERACFLPAVYIEQDKNTPPARRIHGYPEMTVFMNKDKRAWYHFESGPSLTTIASELFDSPILAVHEEWQALVVLSDKHRLMEYAGMFEVVNSAKLLDIQEFERLYNLDGKFHPHHALIAASNWQHHKYASVSLNAGGHNIIFNFNANHGYELKTAIDQATELYHKLPSGSGFNNTWHIAFMGEWVEAVTAYDAMDEMGGYIDPVDLDFTLIREDGKWDVELADTGTEDDEYYGDTVYEALNDA